MSLAAQKPIPYATKSLLKTLIALMTMLPLALNFFSSGRAVWPGEERRPSSSAHPDQEIPCLV